VPFPCLQRFSGTLSTVGVHTAPQFPFPPGALYDKNVTYKSGRCPARRIMTEIALPLLAGSTGPFDIRELVISHRVPLKDAPDAYEMFDRKRDGCTKVVFVCGDDVSKL
jgi:threonine dehydrogenase-like Zn-dependent dehydrogenase